MKVLDALAREHMCFRAMLDRLERCVSVEEKSSFQVSALLRVLLPALDHHEQIEDIVFSAPLFPPSAAPDALARIAAQHEALGSLRLNLLAVLEASGDEAASKIETLVPLLIAPLRAHLETEERLLWPVYREKVTSNSDKAAFRRIEPSVKLLEKALAQVVGALPPKE